MRDVLATAEAQLSIQQRFRIAVARSMRLLAKKEPFDESQHPRVQGGPHGGEFTSTGGGDTSVADKPEQRPAHEPEAEPGQRLTSNAIIAEAGSVKSNSKKVQDVAKEINERAGKIIKQDLGLASIDLDNKTDETDDYVAGVIAQELKDGLTNGKSAADWYDSSMKEAMATADKLYPGMAKDPDQRFAYTAALAISSQGEVVESTVRLADQAYRYFAEHGRFPTDIQAADPNIVLNLKKVNAFIDKLGVAKTREMFDQQFTVRDLKKATGIGVSGMGMDDMVYGSAVLGPKIGQGFYQNLNGNFTPITMDMWFMRAWGRVTNTGIGRPDMGPMYERFDKALAAEGKKVPKSEASKNTLAREINAQHEKDYQEHKADYKNGTRKKSELVYASERIVLSADGAMVEQPRGVAHRRWMTSVFHRALDKLNAEGTRMSPASAQATWWWPEQVLYDKLGARVRETDMDYGKALKKLADARGIKKLTYAMGPGFAPWIDDPDPPDYMTDDEIAAMANRAARYFGIETKEWDEGKHPRVPAGSPDGGQFGSGGGGGSGSGDSKPSGGKSKKPAKKEDFDKAKVTLPPDKAAQDAFIGKWNDKVGVDPATFKSNFMGGLDGPMRLSATGNQINVNGEIHDSDGKSLGNFERNINLDSKSAYSAYFKLNKSATKHDTGKKLLAGNIETYKNLGIEKVTVTANIDVGGYAWAKYGYVPTASAWSELRGELERKLTGGSSSRPHSDNSVEADSWDMLSSDVQDDVRDRWMRDTRSEFIDSEVQNWRDSGQALEDSKNTLVDLYNEGSIPEWASEAFATVRETREGAGDAPIPYTDQQLFAAISLDYKSKYGDGRDDPEVTFDDDKLKEPQGYDPAQQTLPGIEPLDPSQFLSQEMRDQLESEMTDAFNKKAEGDADDIDPPDYLADSVEEYQDEYWGQKDDDEKLRHAIDYGMADIEIEPDEEQDEEDDGLGLDPELFPPDEDPLLAAVRSSDPKSIWKVADSPRGKELLLGTGWSGVLNLKDKAQMDRFDKYVGKAA